MGTGCVSMVLCHNAEFCGNFAVQDPRDGTLTFDGLCITCDMRLFTVGLYRREVPLQFRDATDRCVVCLGDVKREMKFPMPECPHWFCFACMMDLFEDPKERFDLSPVPFGCPPCPDGCAQPLQGPQETCDVCDALFVEWTNEAFEACLSWQERSEEARQTGLENSKCGSKECPLCRKKYVRRQDTA